MKKILLFSLVILITMSVAGVALATSITFSASSGNLAASADFEIVGGNLQVTLTNTSMDDVLVPADVLTAVFFDIVEVGPLTPISALLNGSTVLFGPDGGGDVGGEWAYASGLTGAPLGATQGISSVGFGLFGPFDLFPGDNLGGQENPPNGLDYGILSEGDNPLTGNTPVTGDVPLINNSVIFTLNGLPDGFDPSATNAITNVSFQYGTNLSEPNLPVPEPATMLLLGSGLIGIGIFVRRKFRKS